MTVVSRADQVTPTWLTKVLQDAGFSGVVNTVSWQRIGAGQVGENARFTLDVEGDMPTTVVGKFPSSDPLSKEMGVGRSTYAREVFFYTTIAASIHTQTPLVYATEFDPVSHEFVILMEDLAPGVQVDQMSECSVDQAALALEQLAKLQGPRWGDAQLSQYPLLDNSAAAAGMPAVFEAVHQGFEARYGERLTTQELQVIARFGELQPAYHSPERAQTLIHIDYRVDNMIFGGPHPLTVIDWQSISLGCALNDASYFMGTSLSPQRRATQEQDLLKHYLAVLHSYDVDLTWDECWRLYRRYAAAGLAMAVMASMLVGETDRGNDMFMTMATRSIAMCDELDSLKLLADGRN